MSRIKLTLFSIVVAMSILSNIAAAAEPVLKKVHAASEKAVAAKEVAGAVTVVATPEKVLHLDAVGQADIASSRAMTPDTIFWIASMTKPVTGTAVMMMQDAGKLSIDDQVSKHLPEFKDLKTTDGELANITIRQLLTHTSGLAEITNEQAKAARTLADVIPHYVAKPVQFKPGSKWQYCQSSINTAARIVEVVSDESFPDFLEKRLFKPLGMKDTTFYLTDEQAKRLATSYERTKEGELKPAENFLLLGKSATSKKRFPHANGGLFSTGPDYIRFCQMIANGGELDGHRYVQAETVKQLTVVHTGDLTTGFTPGNGWGIGFCVVREPQGVTVMLSRGTHGHGGAYGTQAWIDPVKKRAYVLMVQRSNFPNADNSDVREDFQQAAVDDLDVKK